MTELGVEQSDHGQAIVLALRGELDLATVPSLRDHLLEAVRTHQSVVLDLAGLTFLDSTGLGLLVSAVKRLSARNGTLVVAAPSPTVRRVLEVSGLEAYLRIEASTGEALATPPQPVQGDQGP